MQLYKIKKNHNFISWPYFLGAIFLFLSFTHTDLPVFAYDQPEQNDALAAKTNIEFQPRLGTYHYEITWGDIRAATGIITIKREGDFYILSADQRTTPAIDRIYRVRYRGEVRIRVGSLTPVSSLIEGEVRKKANRQEAHYEAETGVVNVVETRTKKDEIPDKSNYQIQSDTAIVDLFTAIFLARSFDWVEGESQNFEVFIGKKNYLVSLDCIGKDMVNAAGETLAAWVIRPGVRKQGEDKERAIYARTRIYISADEHKDLVKIKTQLGIGTVKLSLVKYENNHGVTDPGK